MPARELSIAYTSGGEAVHGEDYIYDTMAGTLTITGGTPMTISGTAITQHIEVAKGVSAQLTLEDVNISSSTGPALNIADDSTGDVAITIVGENTLISTHQDSAGLQKNGNTSSIGMLTIGGPGSLTAKGGANGAGIGGGGGNDSDTRSITITGGQIKATGGTNGAGIGGGLARSGWEITIAGGRITATGTDGAGIGGGKGGWSSVTITDGTIKAKSTNGAGIGRGLDGGGAAFTSIVGGSVNASTIYPAPRNANSQIGIFLTKLQLMDSESPVANARVSLLGGGAAHSYGTNDMYTDAEGYVYLYLPHGTQTSWAVAQPGYYTGGPVTTTSGSVAQGVFTCTEWPAGELAVAKGVVGEDYVYDTVNGVLTILSDEPMIISMAPDKAATTHRIEVAKGVSAELILSDVKISSSTGPALKIADDSTGDVAITLAGVNRLISTHVDSAGLQKNGLRGTLTIGGAGSLTATGGTNGAGIGGGHESNARGITITGGKIKATGTYGAGIGGGRRGTGKVAITGGMIDGISTEGFGIGGGDFTSDADSVTTITGGSVKGTVVGATNGKEPVYLTKAALYLNEVTEVRDAAVTGLGPFGDVHNYGLTDVRTDAQGQLHLYLPLDTNTHWIRVVDHTARFYGSATTAEGDTDAHAFVMDDPALYELAIEGGEVGKDFVYDTVNGVLSILSSESMTISMAKGSETAHRIEVDGSVDAKLTLSGVEIAAPGVPALTVNGGSITLAGANVLGGALGIAKNGDGKLTLGGEGSLAASEIEGNNITITDGTITASGIRGDNITIAGGTIVSNVSGENLVITGGSIVGTVDGATNGKESVYLTTLTLKNDEGTIDNQAVTDLETTSATTYGLTGVVTDESGTIYVYLPENTRIVSGTVGGEVYGASATLIANPEGTAAGNLVKGYVRGLAVTGGQEGTDYRYDENVLTILTDAKMTLSNATGVLETDHRIVVDNAGAQLTLSGVNIAAGGAPALTTNGGSITLAGANALGGASGIVKTGEGKLTLGGEGSLTASGITGDKITITGGTIVSDVSGAGLVITGGSIVGTVVGATNGEESVYLTKLTLKSGDAPVANQPVTGLTIEPATTYGLAGVVTDNAGAMYVHLPEGTVTRSASAGGKSYTAAEEIKTTPDGKAAGELIYTAPPAPPEPVGPNWDEAVKEIEAAQPGDTVSVDMQDTSVIPQRVIEAAKEREVTLDTGHWRIDGHDITTAGDIDLSVGSANPIPAELVDAASLGQPSEQIQLAGGDMSLTATLDKPLGGQHAGEYANVYEYVNGELRLVGSVAIDENGHAALPFEHGGEYLIVVDPENHQGRGRQMAVRYLILTVGKSAQLKAPTGAAWASSGDAVTVDASGLATAAQPGRAIVTATSEGAQLRIRIDVVEDLNVIEGGVLGTKKLTVPVYKEQGATIDIALTLPGHVQAKAVTAEHPLGAVVSARFADETAAREYAITPIDDRTYQITAHDATAKKRKSAILIALEDGTVVTTGPLTVTPSKKLPSVKGTVNLADGEGVLTLTGGEVKAIEVTKAPSWLAFDPATGKATTDGTFKKNKTLNLKVALVGWTRPVAVKAKIVNKAIGAAQPTIDKKTVTLFKNDPYASAVVKISGAEVKSITCDNKKFAVSDLGNGEAEITFMDAKVPKKGATIQLKVEIEGREKPVTFKVKVKIAK